MPQPWPEPASALVLAPPADLLRQRPDVRAAEAQLMAAWQRVAQADAARWPVLSLGGTLGASAASLSGLGQGRALVALLLASVRVPLLDGGATRATLQARQAALAQAGAQYDAAVLLALQQVEDNLAALRQRRLQLAGLRSAASAATLAARLADQRWRSGLVDFQVVLDTQRSALATQDAVATVATALGTDHVQLVQALGGGWQDNTP